MDVHMSIFFVRSKVVVFQGYIFAPRERFVPVAILLQYWLSSWTLQTKLGFEMKRGNNSFISSIIVIRGGTCLKAEDSEMYSASTVLGEIYVFKELIQNIGQL